ncbi:putative retrotransposon protein [Tanacetum coccineum]
MSQTTLPKSFFDYPLESVARILNMVPTKKDKKTPCKLWHGTVPNLSYLKVWGCEALMKHYKFNKPDKLEPRFVRDHGEPTNYRVALSDPEFDKWLETMNEDLLSMKYNEFWSLIDLHPNAKTIGSKWLFKKNTNMDDNVHTYKSRLVANGYTKTYGLDYEETFSPIADIKAIRILIAIAVKPPFQWWKYPDAKKVVLSKFQGPTTPKEGNLKEELRVTYYTDDGYETDVEDSESQSGHVFVLDGGTTDWKSAKQSTTAMSSIKAEYIVASKAAMEVVWIRTFIDGLGVVPTNKEPMEMYCDNFGAIIIANELGVHSGAKYYRSKVSSIREVIEEGNINLLKVHTYDNVVDPLTKALPCTKHVNHVRSIGLRLASSLM